jgi:hypothetical protein
MKRAFALEIAEMVLIFLANRPEEIERFLTVSGLDVEELRARMEDPAILSAALNFLAGNESLAEEFSKDQNLKPGQLLHAMATLDPHGSSAW